MRYVVNSGRSGVTLGIQGVESYYGDLPGSLEAHVDKVQNAARGTFGGSDDEKRYCSVLGTFSNSVVFRVVDQPGTPQRTEKTYAAPYTIDATGNVTFGEAKEVKIGVVVTVPPDTSMEQIKALHEAVQSVSSEKCSGYEKEPKEKKKKAYVKKM